MSNNIAQLISGAESLLSSYDPSATDVNIATLSWPSTVVLDGSTMTVPGSSTPTDSPSTAGSTTNSVLQTSSSQTSSQSSPATTLSKTTAAAAAANSNAASSTSATPSSTSSASSSMHSDKRLGIGLGIGLTLLALAILGGVLFCLHRRKRRTGTYLRHHPVPDDGEIDSWRSGQESWSPNPISRAWSEKYAPLTQPTPEMAVLNNHPRHMQPAFMRHVHNDSSSGHSSDNPFHTPLESRAELASLHSRQNSMERVPLRNDVQQTEMPSQGYRSDRPPTPLMHEMMMGRNTKSPVSPIGGSQARYEQYDPINPFSSPPQNERHKAANPFSSPEDDQADQLYHDPPIPPRSPERRHSPQIHYPSGPEVQGFDFGLSQLQLAELRNAGEENHHHQYIDDDGEGWSEQYMHGR